MERTKPHIIAAALLQLHKFTHHINNINATGNLLYGLWGNHLLWAECTKLQQALHKLIVKVFSAVLLRIYRNKNK